MQELGQTILIVFANLELSGNNAIYDLMLLGITGLIINPQKSCIIAFDMSLKCIINKIK